MIFHLYKTFNCRRSLDVYRGNEHVRPCDYVHILLFVQLEVGFAIVEKSQAPCDTDSIGGWLFVDRLSISINMIIDIIGSIFTLRQTQFVFGFFIYLGTWLFIECKNRKKRHLLILGVSQYAYLVYIFGDFYVKTYWKKKKNQ